MKEILLKVLLSGAGAGVVVLILARVIPNEKLDAAGFQLGKFVSSWMGQKLGKSFYEPIEGFLQNSAGVFFAGVKRGLDFDDKGGQK